MPRAFSVVLADDPVSSGRRLLAGLARFDLDPIVAHAVSAADAMALLGVAPCDLLVVGALHPDNLADRLLERVGHDGAAPPLVLSQRTEQQPVPRSEPFYDTLWFWGAVGVVVATVAVILVWNLSSNGDPPPDTTFGNMHAF